MNRSTLGLPVHHQLPEFTQTHVHRVSDAIQPSCYQIANFRWIIEKAREFQKNIYFCFIDYTKVFNFVDHNKLEIFWRDGNTRPPYLLAALEICMQVKK